MQKSAMILLMMLMYAKAFPQMSPQVSLAFANNFLHLPLQTSSLGVWHYKAVKYYKPDAALKKTEEYNYIHNGDNLKGTEDIFTSNAQGTAWLKNFDVGKFASASIDVGADKQGRMNGAFEWAGKLLFFKVLKDQRIGANGRTN